MTTPFVSILGFCMKMSMIGLAFPSQFVIKQIYQDNPISGESNNLYVRLSYDAPLGSGAVIKLSNLANANAATNRQLFADPNMQSGDLSGVPLLSCSGSPGAGCWTQGTSPLDTAITLTISSGSVRSPCSTRERCERETPF